MFNITITLTDQTFSPYSIVLDVNSMNTQMIIHLSLSEAIGKCKILSHFFNDELNVSAIINTSLNSSVGAECVVHM